MDKEKDFEIYLEDLEYQYGGGSSEAAKLALHFAQESFGYITKERKAQIAKALDIGLPTLSVFIKRIPSLKEADIKHHIVVCSGPRCDARNSIHVIKAVQDFLGLKPGQISKDHRFSLEAQNCMKHCGFGPNMKIDGVIYDHMTPEKVKEVLSALD